MAKTRYKYQVKDVKPGKYHFPKFGVIDLRNISDKQAKALIEKGFPYLEKVKIEKEKVS